MTAELLLRFALSQDISTAIVGCSSPAECRALARLGREFEPLTPEEEEGLVELFRPHSGRLAFYRGVS